LRHLRIWKLAADPVAFKPVISKARKESGLKDLVFAGDRGIITKTRIAELRGMPGAGWVTALRAQHRGGGQSVRFGQQPDEPAVRPRSTAALHVADRPDGQPAVAASSSWLSPARSQCWRRRSPKYLAVCRKR
jgi:hypothetical protein